MSCEMASIPVGENGSQPEAGPRRLNALRGVLVRRLPPARLTWIILLGLGILGVQFLDGNGEVTLLVLPAAAVLTDLAFQSVRFPTLHFPDGAIATGLFLALLAPPSVPIFAAATVTFAAIGLKHVLRYKGRPILNPAAFGLVLGAFLFGMAPPLVGGSGPLGHGSS